MTATAPTETTARLFALAAHVYREAGWTGVLPLPAGQKANPPRGFTGDEGAYPDDHQVAEWCRTHAAGNIGVRMPGNVVGIDVDQYDKVKSDGTTVAKHGADDLAAIEADLGVELPATWISTARPAPSGVRWFRVPRGLRFVGELTDSIEILQRHHRYAVVPPSVHPEGMKYRWITPDGEKAKRPPTPDELAELPTEWVDLLLDHCEPAGKRDPIPPRPIPPGAPTRSDAVQRILDDRTAWTVGGRHPAARDLSMRLARLENLGHPGSTEALELVGSEFCAAIEGEAGRKPQKEWDDLVDGARKLAASTTPTTPEYSEIHAEREERQRQRHRDTEDVEAWQRDIRTRTNGAAPPVHDDNDPGPAEPPDDHDHHQGPFGRPAPAEQHQDEHDEHDGHHQDDGITGDELTTWEPHDLGPVLSGDIEQELPTIGAIGAGPGAIGLFYLGRINGLFGESGGGKSWVAVAVAAQELLAGHGAMVIDFEDDAAGWIARFRALGVPDETMAEHFLYIHPDIPLRPEAFDVLATLIEEHDVRLVVLDSLGEVMSLEGVKDEDGPVTAFMQRFPRWLAALGPAIVPIDHVPKSKDAPLDYAIGSQRKRGAVTGALYRVDQYHKMAQGRTGAVKLTVAKDRRGTRIKGSVAAEITFDASTEGRMTATFEQPESTSTEDGKFRPTTLMERVSQYLEGNPGPHSQSHLLGAVKGNRDSKRSALARLVEEGFVSMESEGQAFLYGFIQRFET